MRGDPSRWITSIDAVHTVPGRWITTVRRCDQRFRLVDPPPRTLCTAFQAGGYPPHDAVHSAPDRWIATLLDFLQTYVTRVAGTVERKLPETRKAAEYLLHPLLSWERSSGTPGPAQPPVNPPMPPTS